MGRLTSLLFAVLTLPLVAQLRVVATSSGSQVREQQPPGDS